MQHSVVVYVLTSLYNASRGGVLAVALWHGSWNWVAIMTGVIIVAAPLIVLVWGARHLSPSDRPIVPSPANRPPLGRGPGAS